jgi:hypothetical protein
MADTCRLLVPWMRVSAQFSSPTVEIGLSFLSILKRIPLRGVLCACPKPDSTFPAQILRVLTKVEVLPTCTMAPIPSSRSIQRPPNRVFRNIDLNFEWKRTRPIAEVKLQVSFKTGSITEQKEVL